MTFPPPAMPINRTNATAQSDTHPADHNALGAAINDTVGRLQALIAHVDTDVALLQNQINTINGNMVGYAYGSHYVDPSWPINTLLILQTIPWANVAAILSAQVYTWINDQAPNIPRTPVAIYQINLGPGNITIGVFPTANTWVEWSLIYDPA